jgi:hypothetical protein
MARRRALTVIALLSAASAFAAGSPAPATASGKFEDWKFKPEIAGAYAFWARTGGMGDDQGIRVAVSNAEFKAEAFDAYYDKASAMSSRFADEETKVVRVVAIRTVDKELDNIRQNRTDRRPNLFGTPRRFEAARFGRGL